MLSLLVILGVIIIFLAAKSYTKEINRIKKEQGYVDTESDGVFQIVIVIVSGFVALLSLFFIIINTMDILSESAIKNNIAMYEEENKKIESSVSELVDKYMDYESDMFKDMENESDMILVSLYPDLKSDELVKQQIQIYNENNAVIKKLKEELNNLETTKKLVFFWELF